MPDKKLTDNEIVKALNECLSFEMVETMLDLKLNDIVDLINRLQAESEQKDKNYIELLKTSSERAVIIGEQSAENERLKNILICFMEALGKVRNVDDIDSISLIPLMSELNKGIRAEIKVEAYKEFTERLENAFSKTENQMPNSKIIKKTVQICRNVIRLVLKELVGEDNV